MIAERCKEINPSSTASDPVSIALNVNRAILTVCLVSYFVVRRWSFVTSPIPSSYKRDFFHFVSANLNSSGDVAFDYHDKGIIQMKLKGIQGFDVEGILLNTVSLLEHYNFNLTAPAPGTIENDLTDLYLPAKGERLATLSTEFYSGLYKGNIEFESFVVTEQGFAGMDDDSLYVSRGDFKFNLKLTRLGSEIGETHFIDFQLLIETETALSCIGNNFYQVVGTETLLYVPNQFYAFDEELKRMKLQTMQESFPKLSDLDDNGSQYFTFRFTTAREIFYDPIGMPAILNLFRNKLIARAWYPSPTPTDEPAIGDDDAMKSNHIFKQPKFTEGLKFTGMHGIDISMPVLLESLRHTLGSIALRAPPELEEPEFENVMKLNRNFTTAELKGTLGVEKWLERVLSSLSPSSTTSSDKDSDASKVVTTLSFEMMSLNEHSEYQRVKRYGNSLVAIQSETKVVEKKMNFVQSFFGKQSEVYFSFELLYIEPRNEEASKQLTALNLNAKKTWKYYQKMFVNDDGDDENSSKVAIAAA